MSEHEFEPMQGLPEMLPTGERVLWQGAPHWQTVARDVFHVRKFAIYFGVLLVWRALTVLSDGGTLAHAVIATLWLVPLALGAIGLLALLAWLTSRTAMYTITNQRVVMRIGIVLTITFNIPFRTIQSVGMHTHANGTCDMTLSLNDADRIAYLQLWPHVRPWQFARTEPMLRAVPDAHRVAEILTSALGGSAAASMRASANVVTETSGHVGQPPFAVAR